MLSYKEKQYYSLINLIEMQQQYLKLMIFKYKLFVWKIYKREYNPLGQLMLVQE